jgi:hypothetical protein
MFALTAVENGHNVVLPIMATIFASGKSNASPGHDRHYAAIGPVEARAVACKVGRLAQTVFLRADGK